MIRIRCAGRVLAAISVSVLSLAAAWPADAASARFDPPGGIGGPAAPHVVTVVRTVTVGGTPGWQIVLIAAVAALLAAAAAVLLDRARAARRA